MECKAFLRSNDDLLVTNVDKGQVTVIMDKTAYNQMKALLNDKYTYMELKKRSE